MGEGGAGCALTSAIGVSNASTAANDAATKQARIKRVIASTVLAMCATTVHPR